ncbi:MAG: CARDB domain-containing protein [Methanomassiliicoccales archaeon]
MKGLPFILVFALLTATLLSATPSTAATPPVSATLSGPTLVASGSTHTYVLRVSGGPSLTGKANYSFSAVLHAKNTTGLSITPTSGSSALGVFYINITAGGAAEIVTATFNITSGSGSSVVNASKSFLITVVHAIVITVPVINEGQVGVTYANLSLYINGRYIETETVNLSAGQKTSVTFQWVAYSYPTGTITATVVINSTGNLLFENGQVSTSFPIYIKGAPSNAVDDYLIAAIIVAAVVLVLFVFRRPKPRT